MFHPELSQHIFLEDTKHFQKTITKVNFIFTNSTFYQHGIVGSCWFSLFFFDFFPTIGWYLVPKYFKYFWIFCHWKCYFSIIGYVCFIQHPLSDNVDQIFQYDIEMTAPTFQKIFQRPMISTEKKIIRSILVNNIQTWFIELANQSFNLRLNPVGCVITES